MQDNKNLILAFLISLVILLVFDVFVMKPQREAAEKQMAQQQATEPAQSGEQATPGTIPAPAADGAEAPAIGVSSSVPQGAETAGHTLSREAVLKKEPRVRIDSPKLAGSISLKGGRIDDLTLSAYRTEVAKNSPPVILLSPDGTDHTYFANFGWAAKPGASVALPSNDTMWKASSNQLSPGHPLTLTWDNGQGLVFTRTFALDDDYMFTVTQSVKNTSGAPVTLAPYALVSRHDAPQSRRQMILHEGPIAVFGEELSEVNYKDLREKGKVVRDATGGWLGFTDKYWMTALVPNQTDHYTARFTYQQKNGWDRYQTDFLLDQKQVAPGQTVTVSSRLFAGAKVVALLDKYENQDGISRFDRGVDWGWFYWITKPIFYTLHFLNGVFGNFGLAILALTVLLKLAFFPLANKSYVAMSKMKQLQPKMKQLKERFGDDKVRMQQETMELYKKEKVNPLAGCLPIVIQIPVFFALYKVLFVTIEMRHAPFFGWIHDLSAPDPLTPLNLFGLIPWDPPSAIAIGIWPILMGLSMFLQQKLNPTPPDAIQAKVMSFLPVIFTFILARFSVGLVIYWTWNNILSVTQQWVIMKRMGVAVEAK